MEEERTRSWVAHQAGSRYSSNMKKETERSFAPTAKTGGEPASETREETDAFEGIWNKGPWTRGGAETRRSDAREENHVSESGDDDNDDDCGSSSMGPEMERSHERRSLSWARMAYASGERVDDCDWSAAPVSAYRLRTREAGRGDPGGRTGQRAKTEPSAQAV